ncbi:hypothetical protein J6590_075250, partial [Homalodisca vitripennis]
MIRKRKITIKHGSEALVIEHDCNPTLFQLYAPTSMYFMGTNEVTKFRYERLDKIPISGLGVDKTNDFSVPGKALAQTSDNNDVVRVVPFCSREPQLL